MTDDYRKRLRDDFALVALSEIIRGTYVDDLEPEPTGNTEYDEDRRDYARRKMQKYGRIAYLMADTMLEVRGT